MHLEGCYIVCLIETLCHVESSGCSGLQFCSATYRLMKVNSEPVQGSLEGKKEPLVEVLYKGVCVYSLCVLCRPRETIANHVWISRGSMLLQGFMEFQSSSTM